MEEISASFCLIGSQSLLVECAEHLLYLKHTISAVISDDSHVAEWAKEQCLPYFASEQAYLSSVPSSAFDYLLSLANLTVTSVALIDKARRFAVNFHDGILPDDAGLNVTNWAILRGKKEHGITWHLMEKVADTGAILLQERFPLLGNETALSLNMRCRDVGVESFKRLIAELSQWPQLVEQSQATPINRKHVFRSWQRPRALGVLHPAESADSWQRMMRGLDMGPYFNPITCAKIGYQGEWYIVRSCDALDAALGGQLSSVGEIFAVSDNAITVRVADGLVLLSDFTDLSGQSIDIRKVFQVSTAVESHRLSMCDDREQQLLFQMGEHFAKQEKYWRRILEEKQPTQLAAFSAFDETVFSEKIKQKNLDFVHWVADWQAENTLSSLILYLARLSLHNHISLFVHHQALDNILRDLCSPEGIEKIFADYVPLTFDIDWALSLSQHTHKIQEAYQSQVAKGTFARDLLARIVSVQSPWLAVQDICLCIVENGQSFHALSAKLCVVFDQSTHTVQLYYGESLEAAVETFAEGWLHFAQALKTERLPVGEVSRFSLADKMRFSQFNRTDVTISETTILDLFHLKAQQHLSMPALYIGDRCVSYAELQQQVHQLAQFLADQGIERGDCVGILLDRSAWLAISLLAVMQVGATYIPLDPAYPSARIEWIFDNAKAKRILSRTEIMANYPSLSRFCIDLAHSVTSWTSLVSSFPVLAQPDDLAYMIYTSGSTGNPKGVRISHRNVVNFFVGMDQILGQSSRFLSEPSGFLGEPLGFKQGVWCAVTSISFDISVLEILWSLTRGFAVVLYAPLQANISAPPQVNISSMASHRSVKTSIATPALSNQKMAFSLFFWNHVNDAEHHLDSSGQHSESSYQLLFDAVAFGDENGLEAVWTPERHFGSFGGDYPNPAVVSAALAVKTKNIQIRAGSCVLPLHHPARVAEEWAIVDKLSGGRAGISIASGWQPNDFVLMPDNFASAKTQMFEQMQQVQQLWRGEAVTFVGPKGPVAVRTLPRPIQAHLPMWVTSAGNAETFRQAGEVGANVLTHLLGQSIQQLSDNIVVYRLAWQKAGHKGQGVVTLMLHTLIGENEDEVMALARQPMKSYLKSAISLVKAAAWEFPTFKKMSEETGQTLDQFFEHLAPEDLDALLEHAFLRYYQDSGLFGSLSRCLERINQMKSLGVNEIACLVDYGLKHRDVMRHLPYIATLMQMASPANVVLDSAQAISLPSFEPSVYSLPELFARYPITHFQCTPSQAKLVLDELQSAEIFAALDYFLVGGEALPLPLAKTLKQAMSGKLINVYGPTETTVWSSAYEVTGNEVDKIPIGKPIANTQLFVLDARHQQVPWGEVGELAIGGAGVCAGYHLRDDLNQSRFIANRWVASSATVISNGSTAISHAGCANNCYLTGDLVFLNPKGELEYVGRVDYQVKLRGYRIELGEVEAAIVQQPSVSMAAVVVKSVMGVDHLVAYIVPKPSHVWGDNQGSSATQHNVSATQQSFCATQLRQALSVVLPSFMVPTRTVVLDRLPLTPNGKLDRKALPEVAVSVQLHSPSTTSSSLTASNPLEGHLNQREKTLMGIWCAALGRNQVNIHDNFFDVGGHSLLVIKVLADLRVHFKKPVNLTDLFRHTTISQLAAFFKEEESENCLGSEASVTDRFAASKERARMRLGLRRNR